MIGRRIILLPALAAVSILLAAWDARAADDRFLKGNYQINWDQNVDTTEAGTTETRKFKQLLELKYRGFLSPVVTNEVSFKFEQEINNNTPSLTRYLPALDLGFKGRYWEGKAGAKRTDESTDEVGKNPKITDSYFLEFLYVPPPTIPDLKSKFTIDKDFEEGVTDNFKKGVNLSSFYKLKDTFDAKWDYSWTGSENRIQPDGDTVDQKYSIQFGLRHLFTKKIRFNSEYKLEATKGATLKSDGTGNVEGTDKDDQTHTWKNSLNFRPFRDTSLDGSYDINLQQNLFNGEHTNTWTGRTGVSQRILKPLELHAEFQRTVTDMKHTKDDNTKTEDTWTLDGKLRLSKMFDLVVKYQRKQTSEEYFFNPGKDQNYRTVNKNIDWTGELTPFWKASFSFAETLTTVFNLVTRQETTSILEEKYTAKTTFDFKEITFAVEPTYEVTFKEDHTVTDPTKPASSEIRDFKVRIAKRIFATSNMEAKVDHTYGRKSDTFLANIQRTDSTNGNLAWKEPFPGWTFQFDLTRAASDTSGDDLEADITTSFGVKGDYKRENLSMGTSFKFDKKSLTDNAEIFDLKAGWAAPSWDVSATYTYRKTFSILPQEGYSISLTFKYNL